MVAGTGSRGCQTAASDDLNQLCSGAQDDLVSAGQKMSGPEAEDDASEVAVTSYPEDTAEDAVPDCAFGYDACGAMDLSSCASSKAPEDTDEDNEGAEEESLSSSGTENGHRKRRTLEAAGGSLTAKRKRLEVSGGSSGMASMSAGEEEEDEQEARQVKSLPPKIRNKRRNIKSVMGEEGLEAETKAAKAEEMERLNRLAEQQKQLYLESIARSYKEQQRQEEAEQQQRDVISLDTSSSSDEDKPGELVVLQSSDSDECKIISDEPGDEEEEEDNDEEDPNNSGLHVNDELNRPDGQGRVVVNVGHPADEPDIYLPHQLAASVKPHQIGGIRFLYDNIIESPSRYGSSPGFGCILAHSMGLGKTMQVVSFVEVFLENTEAKKVLCIVPINTIQNWVAEFNYWLPAQGEYSKLQERFPEGLKPRRFPIHVLNDSLKNLGQRAGVIGAWDRSGGVLLMGYELYRQLANRKPRRRKQKGPECIDIEEEDRNKNILNDIQSALVNPGPDLVICDEGHRIKNSHASISQALKQIKTKRRVVLTGYPLQNNLMEYWCMVDFVRPNYLGNKTEFSNMFERPIQNGQCIDSTPKDVRLMKHRAHVLHEQLKGFVQRRGHVVLKESLPTKTEHVLFVRMTEMQRTLYRRFMEELISNRCVPNPLKAFAVCCKIWNHPDVLYNFLKKKEDIDIDFDPEELMALRASKGAGAKGPPDLDPAFFAEGKKEEINYDWAQGMLAGYEPESELSSNKLQIFLAILEDSLVQNDRLLLFSQSLCTLNLLEDFLQKRYVAGTQERWRLGVNYYRLDGSTSALERERLINSFNANPAIKLFLVSTRAGSLGVNLVGANRVLIFDASWNPCHDTQAVCRVYRYGQTKCTHVYRLVTDNSLEKKIYDRQINKQGMADRVVDELNPDAHLSSKEVHSLICQEEEDPPPTDLSVVKDRYADPVLRHLVARLGHLLTRAPIAHESLLVDRKDQKLSRAEKKMAERAYKLERTSQITYSRPSYAAFYPKQGQFATNLHNPGSHGFTRNRYYENGKRLDSWMPAAATAPQRPVASVRPMQSELERMAGWVGGSGGGGGGGAVPPPHCARVAPADSLIVDAPFPVPSFSNVLNSNDTFGQTGHHRAMSSSNDWQKRAPEDSGSSSGSERSVIQHVSKTTALRPDPQRLQSHLPSTSSLANERTSAASTPTSAAYNTSSALAALSKQGVGLQEITVSRDLAIPTSGSEPPIYLKKGDRVMVIKTSKGIYLRMGDKIIKIKQPAAMQGLLGGGGVGGTGTTSSSSAQTSKEASSCSESETNSSCLPDGLSR